MINKYNWFIVVGCGEYNDTIHRVLRITLCCYFRLRINRLLTPYGYQDNCVSCCTSYLNIHDIQLIIVLSYRSVRSAKMFVVRGMCHCVILIDWSHQNLYLCTQSQYLYLQLPFSSRCKYPISTHKNHLLVIDFDFHTLVCENMA